MKKTISLLVTLMALVACQGQPTSGNDHPITSENNTPENNTDKITEYFKAHSDTTPSSSVGSVSKGLLEHASLIPFSGENYIYFDSSSYLSGRAFTHSTVAGIIQESYEKMNQIGINHHFQLMELSNEHGGKIFPHRTHQNGLSADFMMPLIEDNEPCYKYDSLGVGHYMMDFDESGRVTGDSTISINFDLVAQHILTLDESARSKGMKIQKVIINTQLKDELFATEHGKKLQKSDIYIVRGLEPLINDLHDDHYHIDFMFL